MINYLTLPTGKSAPNEVNAVIELPRGQTNKYEFDKQFHVFRLDRNLYSPVHYPGDYGKCATIDRQIDDLVYELYDLTPEEITIVEGSGAVARP